MADDQTTKPSLQEWEWKETFTEEQKLRKYITSKLTFKENKREYASDR